MSEHDAVGAYAVEALPPEESHAFEAHQARCPLCREEVVRLREAASALGLLAAAPPPPPGLRAAVLASIPTVAQLPRELRPAGRGRGRGGDGGSGGGPDGRGTSERRVRVLTLLVAAVSVLALSLGGVVVSMSGRQQAPVAGPVADADLLAAPDARIVRVVLPAGTAASFVVSRSQNRAVFVARDLPDPGPGRTYQLWTQRGRLVVPDSTLGGGAEVSAWFHGSVAEADHLALTVEPAGGSPAPTGPVLVSGAL